MKIGEMIAALRGRSLRPAAILDGSIFLLLAAFTLLRGCRDVADNDFWWHLRAGQWILSEGRIPFSDPFSFGTAERPWIDLQWGFQVLLAVIYGCCGIGGAVALSAFAAMLGVVCCLLPCGRRMPAAICAACWLPSIWLLESRVGPRPEVFSMLFLAAYLAVLYGAATSPRRLWLLPAVQVLWVNSHGLFVLGPLVLGAYLFEAAWQAGLARWHRKSIAKDEALRLRRIAIVWAATCLACLANPYFVEGALLPFELLPKVTKSGNLYKEAINEFRSPARYLADSRPAGPRGEWNLHVEYFLLLALPASFALPAVWRATRQSSRPAMRASAKEHEPGASPPACHWTSAAVLAVVLTAAAALPAAGSPGWIEVLADAAPAAMLLAWAAAAYALIKHSRPAAQLAAFSGAAMSLWLVWAPALLFGRDYAPGVYGALSEILPMLTAFAAFPAALLAQRFGGSLFRMLIAAAFAYLSLQAVRNMALFALVGGAILAWNFGEWGAELASRAASALRGAIGWGVRAAAIGALAAALTALATDRLYRWAGQPKLQVAWGETPFLAPHDAAKFAGQNDLPRRALAYDLGLASVYLFHNSPENKPYIDPRLELPDVKTFDNYLMIDEWLNRRDPRWRSAIGRLGNPLVMLEHREHYGAEAELYRQPDWRCVYYDALASIFVPRQETSRPQVDFAALHFAAPRSPSTPDLPGAAFREGVALSNLGATLRRLTANRHPDRLAIALHALDRLQMAAEEDPSSVKAWTLLGDCYRNLIQSGGQSAAGARASWRVDPDLLWAQATHCYCRALELDSESAVAWERLYDALRARRMLDDLSERRPSTPRESTASPERAAEIESLRRSFSALLVSGSRAARPGEFGAIAWLLQNPMPGSNVGGELAPGRAQRPHWDWPWAEQIAAAWMHLGFPAQARRIWRAANQPPSEALRICRIADSYAASGDRQEALQLYRRAAALDPALAEPFQGQAILHFESGEAESARDACRQALQRPLPADAREHLQDFAKLLQRPSTDPVSREPARLNQGPPGVNSR